MVLTEQELESGPRNFEDWAQEVRELASARDAIILAHNYQVPWIQEVAHFVGDSLGLARKAADTPAREIVFCGVHFMAETAKVLSYDKKVLIPDLAAGCSLSDTITGQQMRDWKAEHPGAVVVTYVNTTAEVKAESDYCCTSSNASKIVESIPADRKILFAPDMFLGANVERETGRKLEIWMGECHVHAGIRPEDIDARLEEHPDAEFHIHPECGCSSHALYLLGEGALPKERTHVLSTGGMVKRSKETDSSKIIVATETGLIHRLKKENPTKEFIAANDDAICRYMKTITPENLLISLKEGVHEVDVPRDIADRARLAIERMIAIG
jgi:quinolinate synthase